MLYDVGVDLDDPRFEAIKQRLQRNGWRLAFRHVDFKVVGELLVVLPARLKRESIPFSVVLDAKECKQRLEVIGDPLRRAAVQDHPVVCLE